MRSAHHQRRHRGLHIRPKRHGHSHHHNRHRQQQRRCVELPLVSVRAGRNTGAAHRCRRHGQQHQLLHALDSHRRHALLHLRSYGGRLLRSGINHVRHIHRQQGTPPRLGYLRRHVRHQPAHISNIQRRNSQLHLHRSQHRRLLNLHQQCRRQRIPQERKNQQGV